MHHSSHNSGQMKMLGGALMVVAGVVQILVLLRYMASPIPDHYLMWATAVGSVLGGLMLFMPKGHGYYH